MAFKNALKMLISKFRLIWVLLLYMIITAVLLVSLSLPFAVPIIRALRNEGIGRMISSLAGAVTGGEGFHAWLEQLKELVRAIKNSFSTNRVIAVNTSLLIIFVLILAYRFIFGLYEIPLCHVLEGAMSSNAKIGFTGRYISRIGKSSCFVLVKMLYTIAFDSIIVLIAYGLFGLFYVRVLKFFAPFIIMLVLLALLALRYSLIAMWTPDIIVRDRGIFRAFAFSVKKGIRYMGSVFSSYFCAWTLIIAVNMLVGLFTFCAGLILTIPLSLLFINLLNMTTYYGKIGRRYYVDDTTVITPPIAMAEENE